MCCMLQLTVTQRMAVPAKLGWISMALSPRLKALVSAAVGILFRPSSVMFWLPQGDSHIFCASIAGCRMSLQCLTPVNEACCPSSV